MLFREAVIAFLGAGNTSALTDEQKAYCDACKKAGFNDCENCDPAEIGKIDG
jgi:hypothetical protein